MARKATDKTDTRANAKARVREALAAQPHRGYPAFEDLLAVADAIIDALDEGAVVATEPESHAPDNEDGDTA